MRVEVAKLRAGIAKEFRALEKPSLDSRMRTTMENKVDPHANIVSLMNLIRREFECFYLYILDRKE